LVIVLTIIGGLSAILYPVIQSIRNSRGPDGDVYPTAAPNEANRVTHPTGLSIVAPVNWDQTHDMGPATQYLQIAARGTPGRRLRAVIAVWRCDPEPNQQTISHCKQLQFQGVPAYEICQVRREDTFDDPASSSYDLYVERKGVWWQVNFLVADKMALLPNSIRQYINTIQFPDAQ